MKSNLMRTLGAHLKGFNIPRSVAHRVAEVIQCFENQPVDVALHALPVARELLDKISESPTLSLRQKIVVRKAYLVIKYRDSLVRKDFLTKDIQAINTEVSPTWANGMHFIKLGMKDFSSAKYRKSASIVSFAVKAAGKRTNNPEAAFEYTTRKISQCFHQYMGLPERIRHYHRWNHVFGEFQPISGPASVFDNVGTVSVTFEQGMKCRLFASPYLHFQAFLEPLKKSLQDVLKDIPEDFHDDQDGGRTFVQHAIREGKTCYCYDLSSATHLFPWELQLRMLRTMGVPSDLIDVFDFTVNGQWTTSIKDLSSLNWKSGQPLGLGPSFFAFSLAHHALIRGIFTRLGINSNGGYCLLGDDVVITNEKVAKVYVKVMNQIGCIINMSKSIISNTQAEFAGSVITGDEIINIGKFRRINWSNAFDYNLRWDNPTSYYKDIVTFVKGQSSAEEADSLQMEFVSNFLAAKVNKIVKSYGLFAPSHVVKKINSRLEASGTPLKFDPSPFDDRLSHFARGIVRIMNNCPDCFSEAVAPHMISPIGIVTVGINELLQSAISDNNDGISQPLWWKDFCNLIGADPDRTFSLGYIFRMTNTFMEMVCLSFDMGNNKSRNRYIRTLRSAVSRFHRLNKEGGEEAVIHELIKLARINGHFTQHMISHM